MTIPVSRKDLHKLYNQLKYSAKRRKINFDLSISDLNNLSFPVSCPILGLQLTFHNGKAQDNSYSIDRIDSSKGYTADNIMVISNKANKLKSNGTLDDFIKMVEYLQSIDLS